MPFIETWDETTPPGSEALANGDNRMRSFKYAIRERLAVDHHFAASEGSDTKIGYHEKTTLINQGSDPATLADAIVLYAKDAAAKSELHSRSEDGVISQLTYLGKLWIAALDIASAARGDIIRRGASAFERLGLGAAGTYLKSDGTDIVYGTPSHVSGQYKNLRVARPTAATVRITADELSLDGFGYATSVDVTASLASSGANGLDTGVESANAWYYVWVIRKSSDGTVAALLSTSSSSPTMPAGYDQKALFSAAKNLSSDLVDFVQEGREYFYVTPPSMVSGDNGFVLTSFSTANFVPSALSSCIMIKMENGTTVAVSPVSSGVGAYEPLKFLTGAPASYSAMFCMMRPQTADTLYYAGNDVSGNLYCYGFVITKLS